MRLDLGVLKQETLDITLTDGTIIGVKKPNKALLVELSKLDLDIARMSNIEFVMQKLEETTSKILSNNTNRKAYTVEDLNDLEIGYDIQMVIFKTYSNFITNVSKN